MNGIDYLKIVALAIVGSGALFCIYRGDTAVGAGLLGSILGYVFGNAHGIISYRAAIKNAN